MIAFAFLIAGVVVVGFVSEYSESRKYFHCGGVIDFAHLIRRDVVQVSSVSRLLSDGELSKLFPLRYFSSGIVQVHSV